MTMKLWRFFPILIKIEVLKHMNLWDKLSFSKCSKKCRNLLSHTPNHLDSFMIPDDYQLSVDGFLTLMTCPKSTIQELEVAIKTAGERDQVNQFLLKLNELRNTLRVKKLTMEINPEYSEMYKKIIGFCDPSFIESIEIESLNSQGIYEDILKTPQWRSSQKIILNWYFDGSLKVNLNDFLHFKSFSLKVEELSVDDAWKLVQNIVSTGSEGDYIYVKTQKRGIQADLIREKIETELVGDWKDVGMGWRYLRHPENPNKILEYTGNRDMFYFGFAKVDYFNMRLALIR